MLIRQLNQTFDLLFVSCLCCYFWGGSAQPSGRFIFFAPEVVVDFVLAGSFDGAVDDAVVSDV